VGIVTSSRVKSFGYPSRVQKAIRKMGVKAVLFEVPDGERHKTPATLHRLYGQALTAGLDRKSLIIAVGGGAITDLAGFFAATYMRGISYLSVPTTLLGMVDASVGGKTGVDLPQGKNLIGAFWQPRLVWIDPAVLQTLPLKEWRTGFSEVIKYGVIKNRSFFLWLERRLKESSNVSSWAYADVLKVIYESVRVKAEVVSGDERESPLKGGREILNFGHTIGHALEAALGYRTLSHGMAVSIGMVAEAHAALQGRWTLVDQGRLILTLQAAGLPTRAPALNARQKARFWAALRRDKKNVAGQIRFVRPLEMGKVTVQSGMSVTLIRDAMRSVGLC